MEQNWQLRPSQQCHTLRATAPPFIRGASTHPSSSASGLNPEAADFIPSASAGSISVRQAAPMEEFNSLMGSLQFRTEVEASGLSPEAGASLGNPSCDSAGGGFWMSESGSALAQPVQQQPFWRGPGDIGAGPAEG